MIPLFKVFMKNDFDELERVLQSGSITQGTQVEKYEGELKKWFSYPHVLSLNSATSGLTLALKLLNLNVNDEVLTIPLTCFATTAAIMAHSLSIKWVDVDPKTCNMDLDDLEKKITPNTKAIVIVHWSGNPIDMIRLNQIRDKYNIPIIEDCAHAFGAMINNQKIGTFGNLAVFSTQAIKHLTTGDGGILLLPNPELYARGKLLRWYGIDREVRSQQDMRMEPDIEEWGYKFHMNDINATIGLTNLPFIQANLNYTRRYVNTFYNTVIDSLAHIQRMNIGLNANPAYWIYTIMVPNKDKFIEFMRSKGITTSQVHRRNDTNSCVAQFKTHLPQLDYIEKHMVCIPCGWWISESEYRFISEQLMWWNNNVFTSSIRLLCDSDAESYIALINQLSKRNFSIQQFTEQYAKIKSQEGRVYVIEINGELIASAKLLIEYKFGESIAHIEDVIVDLKWRHRGIGTQLVKHLTQVAKGKKCYKTVLNAKTNLIPFYKMGGFTDTGCSMQLYHSI